MIRSEALSLAPHYALMKNEFWQFLQSRVSFSFVLYRAYFPEPISNLLSGW